MKDMKSIKLITVLFGVFCFQMFGQSYSLKQAIEYAKQNNSNIKIANLNFDVSDKKVKETIGSGLPQLDFTGSLEDNLKIQTQLLPGVMFGSSEELIPVKFGTKYNLSAGLQLTQKIFDYSFWVGIDAAKLNTRLSEQKLQKIEEEIIYNGAIAYYNALVIQKQFENLKAILAASEQTLKSTELKYQNGMTKKIDVDKIKVSFNNTISQTQQAELNYKQALNNLKYEMGMPVDSTITLSDSISENIRGLFFDALQTNNTVYENRIDYQILKTNRGLYESEKSNNIAAFFPTLSFSADYSYQAQCSKFNFFASDKDWFNSSSIGLTLKVPIFSGFQNYAKVEQSDLNIKIAEENLKLAEQSIKVELSNYEIQYRSALDNIRNEKENLDLAESVFRNTQLEFKQGAGSSLDLVQAESSLRETQNNFYTKLLGLCVAGLDLEKSKGTLNNFYNNLK
ncbi:MAG: TolC family protein [Bacteroidota bacterium]